MATYYNFYLVKKENGKYIFDGFKSQDSKMIPVLSTSSGFMPYDFETIAEKVKYKDLSQDLKEVIDNPSGNTDVLFCNDAYIIKLSDIVNKISKGILTTAYIKKETFNQYILSKHFQTDIDNYFCTESLMSDCYDDMIVEEVYGTLSDKKKKEYVKYTWIDSEDDRFFWYKLNLYIQNTLNLLPFEYEKDFYIFVNVF